MKCPALPRLMRELSRAHQRACENVLSEALAAYGLHHHGGPLSGVAFVEIDENHYAPDPGGRPALIVPHFDGNVLLDLVACGLQTRTCRTREGICTALGLDHIERAKEAGTAVRLFANPIDWMRNGRRGAVIVDWRAARFTLADVHGIARRMQPSALPGFKLLNADRAGGVSDRRAAAGDPWRGGGSHRRRAGRPRNGSELGAGCRQSRRSIPGGREPQRVPDRALLALFFLTVAESGDRKSTVDRLLGRAVRQFQDDQRDASKAVLAAHAADLAAWQAKRDATSGKMEGDAKGGKPIEGHRADLAQIEGEKPDAPRVPRLIYRGRDSARS